MGLYERRDDMCQDIDYTRSLIKDETPTRL